MKAFFTVLAAAILTAGAWAQSPLKMSYQAVIRNTSDQLVTNQLIGIRVSILQGSFVGTVVYSETQTATTNSIGLVSIEIGGETGFDAIDWANGPYFIKTETDPVGGMNYTITNTSQLLSVPYALHAKTAEFLSDGITETDPVFEASPAKTISGSDIANWNSKQNKLIAGKNVYISRDTINVNKLFPNGTTPGEMIYWNGSEWIVVPPGMHGKTLNFCNGIPTWDKCPPLVTTTSISGITATTATSGGRVFTSDGGSPVTARGICWSTTSNPTTSDNHSVDGNGTGTFTSYLTSFTPNTIYYVRAYATTSEGTVYGNEVSFTALHASCGSTLTIKHVAGVVAPVSKAVDYLTVANIPGETSKCWIGQNLGASRQVISSGEEEAPAGWYWQFNHKQGYMHDGSTRTPNTTWITNISESSGWIAANDPCTIELGTDWRIPTNSEWTNVDADGNWSNSTGTWNSGLKLHPAGMLNKADGSLRNRGYVGGYWCSTPRDAVSGNILYFGASYSYMNAIYKTGGYSIRCIKDASVPSVTTASISAILETTATGGGDITYDGGATVTIRGICWSTAPNPTIDSSHTSNGSGTGTFISNLTNLTPNTLYYVRAYSTNSLGPAYGNEVCFTTLPISTLPVTGFTCGSPITVNHMAGLVAPVTKKVTYGTVTNVPGDLTKCWITQNLGADHQATAFDDVTEASAGWYWQFNIMQGYKYDGSYRTPNTPWVANIIENSDWIPVRDPCKFELGDGWRVPTLTEWDNVFDETDNGYWPFSELKMHAAAGLSPSNGFLQGVRGYNGFYWSSTQYSTTEAMLLSFYWGPKEKGGYLFLDPGKKALGASIRCVKSLTAPVLPTVTTSTATLIFETSAISGGSVLDEGGISVTARGICWSTSPYPKITDSHTTEGNGRGEFISNLTNLTPNTLYHIRAYAINSAGTGYGNEVSFTTVAPPVSCGSIIINHLVSRGVAPINKTVTYGLVTNISGETSKCWITSNLGSDHQATTVDDATEASAGWYWQFNHKQGYKHDGTIRTPNTTWIESFSEVSDWTAANDPCSIELGSAWRIPTSSEWTNVEGSIGGNWTNWNGPWNSGLKLHAAGSLPYLGGGYLSYPGQTGYYWSNTQSSDRGGWSYYFSNYLSDIRQSNKAVGCPIRCLKD